MNNSFRVFTVLLAAIAVSVADLSPTLGAASKMVGGYSALSVKDPDAVLAAKYAAKAQKQLKGISSVAIERAERQIVAGSNFRLTLKVKTSVKTSAKIQRVQTVVYQDLQGKYSLTSWSVMNPAKAVAKK